MTYKKNDILIFMTNEPMAHACEIVGEPMDKDEIEKEEYYGFVKSVISHKDGIYLMHTIKPLREIICIAEAADIIRKVDPSEMPENERERPRHEWTEAPNVFIPTQNEAYEKLSDEERCFALAKEALNAHCPEMEIVSMDLKTDWFAKSGKIADVDFAVAVQIRSGTLRIEQRVQIVGAHTLNRVLPERKVTAVLFLKVVTEKEGIAVL